MMSANSDILLAISCLVYNHATYLRQCLDGFIMQQTNFRFVAIVHDDASTDHSAEIIREYAVKYPDIIRPIYETENQWSKSDGSLTKIMDAAIDATGAKYVAICEGDDYWTDSHKLQKQISFLEEHPYFSMCCHAAKVINETSRNVDIGCERMMTREYTFDDAFPSWNIPSASIVFRKEMVDSYPITMSDCFCAGDVVLILKCMHVGRVWGFSDKMSVYRMNAGGLTSQKQTMQNQLKMCKHYKALIHNFPHINPDYAHRYIAMINYTNFRTANSALERIKSLFVALKNCPIYVLYKVLHKPIKPRDDLFYQNYKC